MEALNAEAAALCIWLRTEADAPAQLPWFRDGGLAAGRVGRNQMKAAPRRRALHLLGPAAVRADRPIPRAGRNAAGEVVQLAAASLTWRGTARR
jgi:hypothetical protein